MRRRRAKCKRCARLMPCLAVADHDYDGHRAMAMGAIDVACRLMGSDVRSEGVGHEQQGESDTQLKQAKALLETVRGSAAVAKTNGRSATSTALSMN